MTIKLTPTEIKGFVATSLNLNPSRFDIEIVTPETPVIDAFRQVVKEFPNCRFYDKIPAIKRFRELVDGYSCVGLADAKWAVENPITTLANLARTGSIRG